MITTTTVIPSLSKEYVKVPIRMVQSGADIDPTSYTVELAFIDITATDQEPSALDWITGSWETDSTSGYDRYYARCMVGPGGDITLADGTYTVWVKITTPAETPARPSGRIIVT